MFSLVNPVLDQNRGSDVAERVARRVCFAQKRRQAIVVVEKDCEHFARYKPPFIAVLHSLKSLNVSNGAQRGRLAVMLRPDAPRTNLKKIYRLYKEERLTVRNRGGRKRALGTRDLPLLFHPALIAATVDFAPSDAG